MNFMPANRLRLYRDFKALVSNDYYGIMRFYEQYEDGIRALEFDEYLECTLAYTNALYETGNHGKHLVMCDHLLEIIIMQNIDTWGGEDLYERVLFRKAASLFHLQEYPKAEHVLRELIKIDPSDRVSCRFLEKCLLQQKPGWLMKTRATCVAFSLLAATVVALELFVVKPFFGSWLFPLQVAHNVLLGTAIGVFVAGESIHAWHCRKTAAGFANRVKQRKPTTGSTHSPT